MLQLDRLGLREQVVRMKAQGMSTRNISDELKKHGHSVSHMAVQRLYNSSNEIVAEVASRKEEYQERLVKQHLDILNEITNTTRLVKQKIEELENSGQHQSLISYLKEFRSQLEFLARLTGELNQSVKINVQQNVNYIQNNLIEIMSSMPEESKKELAEFLVNDKLIDKITSSYMINKGLEGLEKEGFLMIKITNNDDETRQLIKSLKKENKIEILTRKTEF